MIVDKLVLLDGMSLAYRAFYGLKANLTNSVGLNTNSIYGFTTMINKIMETEKPSHMLVAFDAGKVTFRHETYADYKAGRAKMPPEFAEQLPYIKQMLELRGIKICEIPLYEADDIIGSYAKKAETMNYIVTIVSGDRDLLQLVSAKTTVKITTTKNAAGFIDYTPTLLYDEKGIIPRQIVDLKGFMGDASDNLPGVPGIGEKTALKLLKEYETMDNVYAAIGNMKKTKMLDNLIKYQDQAYMCKDLAEIDVQLTLPIAIEELKHEENITEPLLAFYRDMGMNSILQQLRANAANATEFLADEAKNRQNETDLFEKYPYSLGDDECASIIGSSDLTYIHTEILDNQDQTGAILGVAITTSAGKTSFWSEDTLRHNQVLRTWASDKTKKKIVYDAKRCIIAFARLEIPLVGVCFDELLAMYIIDPSIKYNDVAGIAKFYDRPTIQTDEEFYGKGKSRVVPEAGRLRLHICQKVAILRELYPLIEADLAKNEQLVLLESIELPLALVLAEMELTGIKVDDVKLKAMGASFATKITALEAEIHTLAGQQFAINSVKQLGIVLFEHLGLPARKKTKTGYSTSIEVLEDLLKYHPHPIIEKIILYRQLNKLRSTYVEGLLKLVHKDGKLHTRFNQVIAQTGRLSSVEPNLQNIPIRLEEGRKIRSVFIPEYADWLIVAADYSQIELRVLAHLSQDDNLIGAFNSHLDVHTKTAMDIFAVNAEAVTANMRRQAKAVNFGIVYGISDYGLAQNLGIMRKEAKVFIERYFATFPKVKDYMHSTVENAKDQGYVTTLSNRRRYIPDINSSNFNTRGFAERVAMNTPVQGSAADIIKLAMIQVARRLEAEALQARMLLQVHDELVFEAPRAELAILKEIITEEMENVISLSVALIVNISYGASWYEAK